MTTATSTWSEQEAVQKVLRRAEVSRIARVLQHRLALATYKTRHGLENLDLDTIEPRVEDDLKRKRSLARVTDDHKAQDFGEGDLGWLRQNGGRHMSRSMGSEGSIRQSSSSRKRPRTSSSDQTGPLRKRRTWKENHRLPQSSPGYRSYKPQERRSEQPKLAEYPLEPAFHSSPPRTPPRRLMCPPGPKNMGQDGADLLVYLATSPSPRNQMEKTRFTPTTPPSKSSVLPSSMMNSAGAPQTPSQQFNFADFVNITPSPAQAAFPSSTARTPSTIARRRLNFDQLVPPTGSPLMAANLRLNGVGIMELGGELVSSS